MNLTTAQLRELARARPDVAAAVARQTPAAGGKPATGCRVTLPYPPGVNGLYATVGRRRVKTAKGRAYARNAATIALAAGVTPASGPVAVYVILYRPRRIGDIDGPLKAALDAMTGVAYGDDGQIDELHVWRRDDPRNPRAEIAIVPRE